MFEGARRVSPPFVLSSKYASFTPPVSKPRQSYDVERQKWCDYNNNAAHSRMANVGECPGRICLKAYMKAAFRIIHFQKSIPLTRNIPTCITSYMNVSHA